MPPRQRTDALTATTGPVPVEAITHADTRLNLPTADAHDLVSDEVSALKVLDVERNTALDPQLVWRGKDAQDPTLAVAAPPIYIQEKIDPRVLIEDLRRTAQRPQDEPELSLFDDFDGLRDFEAVEYYRHEANWSNRMVLGDSLEVMASLAEREDLRGQVQCIYIDPPYGIKFASNWQVATSRRDVKDKISDASREVEQIKAFRDTWELGIHSYLSYLRDRLQVAHSLLTESGSVFVQIGDENVHLVRSLLDEAFGRENFVSQIAFSKTGGMSSATLGGVYDLILWYAKSTDAVKVRPLYQQRVAGEKGATGYTLIELPDGSWRSMSKDEKLRKAALPRGSTVFDGTPLVSGGASPEGSRPWQFNGRTYACPPNRHWTTNEQGRNHLTVAGRVIQIGNRLEYKRYFDDFSLQPLDNLWLGMGERGFSGKPIYVVQTDARVIERCLLMTTDPGDLVLDPTCGSGTTAYVAEQWGRRWITIDTSRVALALARQRLMAAKLPYYLLADSPAGQAQERALGRVPLESEATRGDVRHGFVYERVPHVTLKSIANNPEIREGMTREQIDAAIARHAETEVLYDRPYEDKTRVRVAGRFTVESLSPHRALSLEMTAEDSTGLSDTATAVSSDGSSSGASSSPGYERTILDNLLAAGVQNGRRDERLRFADLEPHPGLALQAVGIRQDAGGGTPQRVAVAIGPEYGTVSPAFIKAAAREALRGAGYDLLLVLGFSFDAQSLETVGEFRPSDPSDFATVADERRFGRLPVLLVRMNADLAMGDELLKKTGAANLFTVFGEPDITVETTEDGIVVEIRGVDVYNPTTGEVRVDEPDTIALWMVDTDYDGDSFFVRHAYFAGGGDPYARLKRALKADVDEAAWESLYGTRSRPFPAPSSGRIAVKAINDYGDEVLSVIDVP